MSSSVRSSPIANRSAPGSAGAPPPPPGPWSPVGPDLDHLRARSTSTGAFASNSRRWYRSSRAWSAPEPGVGQAVVPGERRRPCPRSGCPGVRCGEGLDDPRIVGLPGAERQAGVIHSPPGDGAPSPCSAWSPIGSVAVPPLERRAVPPADNVDRGPRRRASRPAGREVLRPGRPARGSGRTGPACRRNRGATRAAAARGGGAAIRLELRRRNRAERARISGEVASSVRGTPRTHPSRRW